mgnify:CR=1 FL=1
MLQTELQLGKAQENFGKIRIYHPSVIEIPVYFPCITSNNEQKFEFIFSPPSLFFQIISLSGLSEIFLGLRFCSQF